MGVIIRKKRNGKSREVPNPDQQRENRPSENTACSQSSSSGNVKKGEYERAPLDQGHSDQAPPYSGEGGSDETPTYSGEEEAPPYSGEEEAPPYSGEEEAPSYWGEEGPNGDNEPPR